jgi:hypothetical protein
MASSKDYLDFILGQVEAVEVHIKLLNIRY